MVGVLTVPFSSQDIQGLEGSKGHGKSLSIATPTNKSGGLGWRSLTGNLAALHHNATKGEQHGED